MSTTDKQADLAGPGIGTYEEVAEALPKDYESLLTRRETMEALFEVKRYIEDGLAKELNLMMVQVPLIVDEASGVNDYLDRDGSRTPVQFPAGLRFGQTHPGAGGAGRDQVEANGSQDLRLPGGAGHQHRYEGGAQGLLPGSRSQRLCRSVGLGAGHHRRAAQPRIPDRRGAADMEGACMVPRPMPRSCSRSSRATSIRVPRRSSSFSMPRRSSTCIPICRANSARPGYSQDFPAVFIYGIGWPLADGYPHEMRAADYDDWVTETITKNGQLMHGLNGDILVWNHVTKRRHELTSMGVRVTKETLVKQLEMSGQMDFLELPYHQAIMNDQIPLSIGGGIGQSRTYMYLLKKAHLGEVSVTVWPQILKEISRGQEHPRPRVDPTTLSSRADDKLPVS